jgi:subtilase family serine protease
MVSSDNVLAQGAMQGQTLFASSGDNGDGCAFVAATGVPSSFPGTNWPASGMYTTAVGGTSLISDANGNRVEEIGWVGSGGGDSETEEPGFWTQDSDPFYNQELAQGGRAVPGFTDIVVGNNGGYSAIPGYDEVTGIGVLDVAALNTALGKS